MCTYDFQVAPAIRNVTVILLNFTIVEQSTEQCTIVFEL